MLFVTQTIQPNGGFGGGQLGCNYQIGLFVWGVEGDIQGSNIKDGFGPTTFTASSGAAFTSNVDERLKWFGAVRERVGIAPGAGPVLLYVTGGVAFGGMDFTQFAINNCSGAHFTLADDSTKTGWVLDRRGRATHAGSLSNENVDVDQCVDPAAVR